MNLVIYQKQSRSLLEEHAHSSFNFTFLGKNELFIAFAFFLIGVLISIVFNENRFVGIPFMAIACLEIIKFPSRERRWVKKKEKEKIFNKIIAFEINNTSLKISYSKEEKWYPFSDMRACLISETGVLFKISWLEYYYISFKSVKTAKEREALLINLHKGFKKPKIKNKIHTKKI